MPPTPARAEATAQPVDLATVAHSIAESAPSLRFVAIDLSPAEGATEAERAYFRVHDTGRVTRRVERMDAALGRATVATMRGFNRFD